MDPDLNGAGSLHVSGFTPQLEFDGATSITTNERIPILEGLQAVSGKRMFQPGMFEMVVKSTVIVMKMSGCESLTKTGMMCT